MVTGMKLHNFKAFENLKVGLRPITIVLGPNNSGKSSIIAPLRLLVQTMESYDREVPLLLDGIMGDFGTYKDIVYKNHRGRPFDISVDFELGKDKPRFLEFSDVRLSLGFKYRTKRRELILKELRLFLGSKPVIRLDYSVDSERSLVSSIGNKALTPSAKSMVSRNLHLHHFLPNVFAASAARETSEIAGLTEEEIQHAFRVVNVVSSQLREAFNNVEYIGAMRIPPARTYLFTGEKRKRVGATGENAASLLVMDAARRGKTKRRLQERASQWLKRAGIADGLEVVPLSERHYEIRVSHPITKEKQNISDVGYGNSQVIPVLIGGYSLDEGDTFLVEEPEIHLHPKAQAELGGFFFELYRDGIQSIVETHSEYLLLRLQRHVADKEIPPEDIIVYYVEPKAEGVKEVTPFELDGTARFIDDWPEGFFPEKLEEAKGLARTRYKHSNIKT